MRALCEAGLNLAHLSLTSAAWGVGLELSIGLMHLP